MGLKLLNIFFAIIIVAGVLSGALLLLRNVFPEQVEKLPIIGAIGRPAVSSPSPSAAPESEDTGDESTKQTPSPSSLENGQDELSSPTPTPAPASPKAEASSKSNTAVFGKTTYTVQPSPIPTVFKVTYLTINSSPANYSGSCPKDVTFYATITTNGAGSVNYRFIRSDGTETGENSISFDFASSKSVENTWSKSGSGWEKLKITSPNTLESSQATFNINCN